MMNIPKKVLADSSFLIALLNKGDKHHENATAYLKFLAENEAILFLSPIVGAELNEDLNSKELPLLKSLRMLTFTFRDGDMAAEFRRCKHDRDGASRDCVKDDLKILAQAITNDMDALITADSRAITRLFEVLHPSKDNHLKYIDITQDYKTTFNVAPTLFEGKTDRNNT